MSTISENIRRNRSKPRTKITVEAWGDGSEPAVIYASALTAGDIDRIQKKHKDFLSNMSVAAMVDLIILKAETAEGDKVFTLEDRPILMRESLTAISDVAGQMFGEPESIEEMEKN